MPIGVIIFIVVILITSVIFYFAATAAIGRQVLEMYDEIYICVQEFNEHVKVEDLVSKIDKSANLDLPFELYMEYIQMEMFDEYRNMFLSEYKQFQHISEGNNSISIRTLNNVLNVGINHIYDVYFSDNDLLYRVYTNNVNRNIKDGEDIEEQERENNLLYDDDDSEFIKDEETELHPREDLGNDIDIPDTYASFDDIEKYDTIEYE
nr:MAG TPA: hypothetical protein [Caudoviricetes sp.]